MLGLGMNPFFEKMRHFVSMEYNLLHKAKGWFQTRNPFLVDPQEHAEGTLTHAKASHRKVQRNLRYGEQRFFLQEDLNIERSLWVYGYKTYQNQRKTWTMVSLKKLLRDSWSPWPAASEVDPEWKHCFLPGSWSGSSRAGPHPEKIVTATKLLGSWRATTSLDSKMTEKSAPKFIEPSFFSFTQSVMICPETRNTALLAATNLIVLGSPRWPKVAIKWLTDVVKVNLLPTCCPKWELSG